MKLLGKEVPQFVLTFGTVLLVLFVFYRFFPAKVKQFVLGA